MAQRVATPPNSSRIPSLIRSLGYCHAEFLSMFSPCHVGFVWGLWLPAKHMLTVGLAVINCVNVNMNDVFDALGSLSGYFCFAPSVSAVGSTL